MAQRTAGRERTVCNHCDLPFYSDSDGCPYCESAGRESTASTESPEGTTHPTAEGRDAERESLLTRLKQALGM